MASEPRFSIGGMAWLEMRRAVRNPGVFVNDLIFGVVSLFVALHRAADEPLFVGIRLAIYVVIVAIGGIVMAELNAKDPGFLGMLMERGAFREACFAVILAQTLLWQLVTLPSLLARLIRAPDSVADLLPQWLATLGLAIAVGAAVQWITLEATRRDWVAVGPWLIPSLVIVFLAVFLALGFLLLGLVESQGSRQWMAVAYCWTSAIVLLGGMTAVAATLPRRKHSTGPGA